MEAVRYLTIDQVIEFHADALREFGGLDGIRSPHQLSAAVLMPQQSAFGEDAYPSVPEKAAAYGFFIAEAQAVRRRQQADGGDRDGSPFDSKRVRAPTS